MTTYAPDVDPGKCRGVLVRFAVRAIEWARSQHEPFDKHDFAAALGCNSRTALRWLDELHAAGVIRQLPRSRSSQPFRYVAATPADALLGSGRSAA